MKIEWIKYIMINIFYICIIKNNECNKKIQFLTYIYDYLLNSIIISKKLSK